MNCYFELNIQISSELLNLFCYQIKKHKLSYFKSVWNILDILVIMIAILCVAFDVYRTVEVDSKLSVLLDNPDKYADFEFLSFWQTRFDNAIAIAVFLAWIKVCFEKSSLNVLYYLESVWCYK